MNLSGSSKRGMGIFWKLWCFSEKIHPPHKHLVYPYLCKHAVIIAFVTCLFTQIRWGRAWAVLWHGASRHAKWEGRVYACIQAYALCKSCPECSVHVLCLCRKVWKWFCVKWPARKSDVRESQGWWHQQWSTSMKRLASLSRSSLAVRCMGVSAFRFPIVGVLSLDYYALPPCTWAWQHGHVQHISITWMGQT